MGETGAKAIEAMIASASNIGSGLVGTIVGIITFVLAATGAFVELQDDLNLIWKVKPRESSGVTTFLRTRFLSLALVVGVGFLLLVSLILDAGVTALGSYLEAHFSGASVILHVLNSAAALAVAVLLFAMVFKVLPDVDLAWHDVWTGAVITGVLFTVGKFLISLYLGISNVDFSFGAAASIITILLWVYYSSLILLYGAAFTKVYAESHGAQPAEDPGPCP